MVQDAGSRVREIDNVFREVWRGPEMANHVVPAVSPEKRGCEGDIRTEGVVMRAETGAISNVIYLRGLLPEGIRGIGKR